jgi:hypothetical protein
MEELSFRVFSFTTLHFFDPTIDRKGISTNSDKRSVSVNYVFRLTPQAILIVLRTF